MRQTCTAGDNNPQTTHPERIVRADSPATLLAVIPHLLGFIPEASVVVIGTAPPRSRIRVTLRYDLPDPPGLGAAADLAAHAAGVVGAQRLDAAVAVGYGPETLVAPVAEAIREAFSDAGIELQEFLRVQDLRYWSYVCRNEACCPAAGVPLDPDLHSAAALADFGLPVLADRTALAARVAPLGGITAESMRQATRRAEQHIAQRLAKVRKSARLGAARQMIATEGLAAVGAMITRYREGGRFTTDYEIARITVALRDLRVRRAQLGHVAAPAALLAFVAWQSGDGALANVALDRALADDPRYSMALLLRQVITAGAPPALARLPMTPEEVAASYDGRDVDDPDPEADDED
jgi:hypothetical protein